jgi:KaiC/GvpD/RAD55 family RecA-like ATPase
VASVAEPGLVNRTRPEDVYLLLLWFPTHYAVLVEGPPGVGKLDYVVVQMRDALSIDERVVFVALDIHPDELRLRSSALGLDLGDYEGRSFAFVDCYGPAVEGRVERADGGTVFRVSSYSNLEGLDMAIHKAAAALGEPVRIFVYSASTLFLHNGTQAITKFLQLLTARVKTGLGFILYVVQDGVHDSVTTNILRSFTDGVVEMRFDDKMQRELRTHHMRGYRVLPVWHKFDRLSTILGDFI